MFQIYEKLKKKIKGKAKNFLTRKETQFGDIRIRELETEGFITTITYRGEILTLSSDNLGTVQDVLLDLKKSELTLEETLSRISGKDILRILQLQKNSYPLELKEEDGNLLLLDLLNKVTPQGYAFGTTRVDLTPKGVEVLKILFRTTRLEEQLFAYVYSPLISHILELRPFNLSEYLSINTRTGSPPNWEAIDSYLARMASRFAPFRDIKQWHFQEKARRIKLLNDYERMSYKGY